jgi:membrane protein DedA with SNARE-associated domain
MPEKPGNTLMQYAGFAAQLAAALLLAVFAGQWLDKHTGIEFPILIWLLPLLVLIVLLIKVVRDTSKK